MSKLKSESESGRMLYETTRPMHFGGESSDAYREGYDAIDWSSGPAHVARCKAGSNCTEPAIGFVEGNDLKPLACTAHGGVKARRVSARESRLGKNAMRLL